MNRIVKTGSAVQGVGEFGAQRTGVELLGFW